MHSAGPVFDCALDDIEDPGSRGFAYGPPGERLEAFVVRHGRKLSAWVNVCPHAGNRLNWKPDAFLTRDRTLIMCSVHGAIFEPHSGLCVGGPCPGRRLRSLPCEIRDGQVLVFPAES